MTDAELDVLEQELRKMATVIYIAVAKPVADDISRVLLQAAEAVAELREEISHP